MATSQILTTKTLSGTQYTAESLMRAAQIIMIMEKEGITFTELENQLSGARRMRPQNGDSPIIQTLEPQIRYVQVDKTRLPALTVADYTDLYARHQSAGA